MSPIDDELRAALRGRAPVLTPSPDPLAGIERRARRIQRSRVGAAVAGSALAVALIAVAVPAVQRATSTGRPDAPIVGASQAPDTPAYALDPLSPWTYRGAPLEQLGPGTAETIAREYAVRRGVEVASITPLYGQVYGSSQQFELVFLAEVQAADGASQYFWGVSRTPGDGGPEFVWDEALAEPALALAAALPGDGVPRLLVVAAPDAGPIYYGSGEANESAISSPEAGVAVAALERDIGNDYYRVLAGGQELVTADAPDPKELPEPTAPRTGAALDPGNPWELRGDRSLVSDEQLDALAADWALRNDEAADAVTLTPLYVAADEPSAAVEVVYLARSRDGPWSWGASALGNGRWFWYVDRPLEAGAKTLPAVLPGDEGVARLLLLAAPFVGGALYAADGSSYEPMADREPGVFITPVSPGNLDDRFKVLDGNGDLDDPIVEGEVPDLQNGG